MGNKEEAVKQLLNWADEEQFSEMEVNDLYMLALTDNYDEYFTDEYIKEFIEEHFFDDGNNIDIIWELEKDGLSPMLACVINSNIRSALSWMWIQ